MDMNDILESIGQKQTYKKEGGSTDPDDSLHKTEAKPRQLLRHGRN